MYENLGWILLGLVAGIGVVIVILAIRSDRRGRRGLGGGWSSGIGDIDPHVDHHDCGGHDHCDLGDFD